MTRSKVPRMQKLAHSVLKQLLQGNLEILDDSCGDSLKYVPLRKLYF